MSRAMQLREGIAPTRDRLTTTVFMAALVGLSRIYLGAHYLSDVLAAMCEAFAWLALCLTATHTLHARRMARGRRGTP